MMTVLKSTFGKAKTQDYSIVDDTHKGYEERHYGPSMWISMSQDLEVPSEKNEDKMCTSLFNYILGENESKRKLDMAFPVMGEYVRGEKEMVIPETKRTLSFYVPPALVEDLPKPTAPGVYISEKPAMTVFVKTFGGFASDDKCMEEMKKFIPVLEADGHKVRDDVFYFAWFNTPLNVINRRNEVWLLKKEGEKIKAPVGITDVEKDKLL